MQGLTSEHLFWNRGDLATLPATPPLTVDPGEAFLIETMDTYHGHVAAPEDIDKPAGPMAGNPWTGPVYVRGIRAGEVIAVAIEKLQVVGHCFLHVGADALLPPEFVQERTDFVRIAADTAHFPGGVQVPVKPMWGCFGIVPTEVYADPWEHGGNMDIPDIGAGSVVHVRCQREGAWFGCGDGHARQGEGETTGASLEVSLLGQVRIGRSPYQHLQAILVETPEEFITVGVRHEFEHAVRLATYAMADLLAQVRQMSLLDAYQVASQVGDLRVGAIWPLWCKKWHIAVPACLHLSKAYFEERA